MYRGRKTNPACGNVLYWRNISDFIPEYYSFCVVSQLVDAEMGDYIHNFSDVFPVRLKQSFFNIIEI